MISQLIKNGDIDKARRYFKQLDNSVPIKPIRRSKLAEFEEKAKNYLDSLE